MITHLKDICFNSYKTKNNIFIRAIGVEDPHEYENILKTLVIDLERDKDHCLCFDSEIALTPDFDLLNSIKSELNRMDVLKISGKDIILFPEDSINNKFISALNYVVNLSVVNENFLNDSVRNNFICKMILYSYNYLTKLKLDDCELLKCIYYGDIARQDIYFLILLNKMNFNVLYLNPLREDYWENIDKDNLSKQFKYNNVSSIETLSMKSGKGIVIEESETITCSLEQEIEDNLFTDTGFFKPWQYRSGDTRSVLLRSTIIDISQNILEPARVRQGFRIEDKTVFVPHFFFEIEGEYKDIVKYKNFVEKCTNGENTIFIVNNEKDLFDFKNLEDEKYNLIFCQLNDGTFDIEKIKELSFYSYSMYNDLTENFILNKLNETIRNRNIFKSKLNKKEDILDFCLTILCLDKMVIRAIDNFDFTENIPKIIFFLENDKTLSKKTCYLLAFLNSIGFDIIILTPAGLSNLNSFIDNSYFINTRLDLINYDRTLSSLFNQKKFGFFSKLFML